LVNKQLQKIEYKISYLLGAFRDGSIKRYGSAYEIVVSQKSLPWLESVIRPLLRDVFGTSGGKIKFRRGVWNLKLKSKAIYSAMVSEYDFPETGNQVFWKTPSKLLEKTLPTEAYLSGFFDSEGSVGVKPPRIDFFQSWCLEGVCPPLVDIKSLLDERGIKSGDVRLRKKNYNQNHPRCVLSITNKRGVEKFSDAIGSLHPVKREKLVKAAGFGQRTEAAIL